MDALTLNPYIGISKTDEDIVAYMYSSRSQIVVNYDPALEKLIDIAGEAPYSQWLTQLRKHYPVSDDDFLYAMDTLKELGIVIPCSSVSQSDSPYSRQDAFFTGAGFDATDVRTKLSDAKVLIFGLGGIGSNLLEQLTIVGVRNFVLVDADQVEQSNLNRSTIFTTLDVGKHKADALRDWVVSRNPGATVHVEYLYITGSNDVSSVLSAYPETTLIVSCMDEPDSFAAATWVSEVCWPLGIPHFVSGGYHLHGGLIGHTCIPGETPCAACYSYNSDIEQIKFLRKPTVSGSYSKANAKTRSSWMRT